MAKLQYIKFCVPYTKTQIPGSFASVRNYALHITDFKYLLAHSLISSYSLPEKNLLNNTIFLDSIPKHIRQELSELFLEVRSAFCVNNREIFDVHSDYYSKNIHSLSNEYYKEVLNQSKVNNASLRVGLNKYYELKNFKVHYLSTFEEIDSEVKFNSIEISKQQLKNAFKEKIPCSKDLLKGLFNKIEDHEIYKVYKNIFADFIFSFWTIMEKLPQNIKNFYELKNFELGDEFYVMTIETEEMKNFCNIMSNEYGIELISEQTNLHD